LQAVHEVSLNYFIIVPFSTQFVIMDMLRYIRSRIPGAQEARKLERDEFFDFQRVSHDIN
jgi:hypothetical protein